MWGDVMRCDAMWYGMPYGKAKKGYAVIKFLKHSTHAHRHTKAIIRSTGISSTKIYPSLQKKFNFFEI